MEMTEIHTHELRESGRPESLWRWFPLICILLCGFLAYANTFAVPFLFDDNRAIVNSNQIKQLSNLWPPADPRWVGNLTFALNYAVGGLNVFGYHLVNLGIHLVSAILVYRLTLLTFQTPFHSNRDRYVPSRLVVLSALVAALFFVAHPVQTQAVTYIVQRFASLATLLYLASLVCYIEARQRFMLGISGIAGGHRTTVAWYTGSLTCCLLAMKTKEIAFTLPMVIVLYEYAFYPRRPLKERLLFLAPLVATMAVIPLTLLLSSAGPGAYGLSSPTISPYNYLLTQFRVIVTYLRLLIWPVNQMIDYDFTVSRSLLEPPVLGSLALLVLLVLLSVIALVRGGRGSVSPLWRLAGFGGMWFFMALSVESSFIPITDVIFEHRIYLPSVGVALFLAALTAILIRIRYEARRNCTLVAVLVVLPLVCMLTAASYLRNRVWQSEASLWRDVANKSPNNARAQAILGITYIQERKIDLAIDHFQKAIQINPSYGDGYVCLGNAYMEKGLLDEANQAYLKALALGTLDFESTAQLLMNLGNYNLKKGNPDQAIYYYIQSLGMMPDVADTYRNLAEAYKAKGRNDKASEALSRAHQLNPDRY